MTAANQNMLGAYGPWAAGLLGEEPGPLSFRSDAWQDIDTWRTAARDKVLELLAQPSTGGVPEVSVDRQFVYDGLRIEALSWQLPYGPRTEALLLKPEGARGKLPGIVALHDHGGIKCFGKRKIARTSDTLHPMITAHMERCYGGLAWANEVAKRGYAVLVPDAFAFESRRVLQADLPERVARQLNAERMPEDTSVNGGADIQSMDGAKHYNNFAHAHERLMSRSLFCAGTTWPGVFSAEDQRALDYLCSRDDVDEERMGCGGLSGGGLRTVFLAGLDDRIKCAVAAGFMTTWRDFLLNKCHTHTWMLYVPLLPNYMDFPEIISMRAPLPTLVLNTTEDPLYTVPEMERAASILNQAYDKAGASDRFRCSFYEGPHKFDVPMQAEAFDWFDRWLL